MAPATELVMRQCGCRAWDLGLAEWPLRLAKRQVGVCAHSRSTATSAPSLLSASGCREGGCEACRRLRTQRGSLGPGGRAAGPVEEGSAGWVLGHESELAEGGGEWLSCAHTRPCIWMVADRPRGSELEGGLWLHRISQNNAPLGPQTQASSSGLPE